MGDDWLRTGIGRSTPDAITVRGRDLATELMGQVTFTELAFFLTANRMPSPGETRLFDAALVSLADHGLTPSVLAARLTWTGATESLQGAVAAGLLGAGNVFLGVVEDTARFLAAILGRPDRRRRRTGWRPRSPPGAASPGSATPSTRWRTPAPPASTTSPRRPGSPPPTSTLLRTSPRPTPPPPARPCRSTAPAPPGQPGPTSASRRRSCGASPSWPAPPG